MENLVQMSCVAYRRDAPHATEAEISEFRPQIPEWEMIEQDQGPHLERQYQFGNFAEALAFTGKVGDLAESEAHHPALLTEWGRVTVHWWTKKIRGLHRNDFIMAAKTDQIYSDG